ncbi:hypothetical protein ERJ75_001005900 [Trypanosoma vivax]|uniref:Uncharacterized protein n=1 Tax=Trypanosoma vivax (strain Y486) TaxID=1055687 RepID=G0TYI9_TRYVY|nr:hypothetical protein TRVL_02227 [Trypanosoma vivax]KAH8611503.1 hypothetical protein ERJ75_001005900 [Trypanosoma vivax]CCC49036.1 conserved hypothetical protein [Trypanosoma vivax Y486]
MTAIVTNDGCEIDLEKLINYTMTFQPLQLLLQDLFKRVKDAEDSGKQQNNELILLRNELDELRRRDADREVQLQELLVSKAEQGTATQPEKKRESLASGRVSVGDEPDRGPTADPDEVRALWEEIKHLKKAMGDINGVELTPSIETLYAARKRKESLTTTSDHKLKESSTSRHRRLDPTSDVEMGDVILSRAREHLNLSSDGSQVFVHDSSGETAEPQRHDVTVPQTQLASRDSVLSPAVAGSKDTLQSVMTLSEHSRVHATSTPSEACRTTPPLTGKDAELLSAQSQHNTLFDRLRQDEEGIAHLNRVVAEILGSLENLQKDMEQVPRMDVHEGDGSFSRSRANDSDGELKQLQRRLLSLENKVDNLKNRTFGEAVGSLASPNAGDVAGETGKSSGGFGQEQWRHLDDRINSLASALERVEGKIRGSLASTASTGEGKGISHPEVSVISGTVDVLEKQLGDMQKLGLRNYDNDLEMMWNAVEKLQRDIAGLNNMSAALDEKDLQATGRAQDAQESAYEDTKQSQQSLLAVDEPLVPKNLSVDELKECVNEIVKRLNNLQLRVAQVEGNVLDLDDRKADRAALQLLIDDVKNMRQLLELTASKSENDGVCTTATLKEELLQKMQQEMNEQIQGINSVWDGTNNELGALRDYVEQIDHRKADAKLVANKAERDYVENALERLMREVEQVLNATNAGLIETLDKSLNVLRDMLDGKATKGDVANIQRMLNEEHTGTGAPDALLGFRGFRCLGCNRSVDKMRLRPMGNRPQSFINRLPQNLPSDQVVGRIQEATSAPTSAAK